MARWSDATLVALGGFDKNVVIDEILYGEDNIYPVTFLRDSGRTVGSISGTVVTFAGGDMTPFTVGAKVSFGASSNLYTISVVTTTTFTLNQAPVDDSGMTPAAGATIQATWDMTGYTFSCRLLEHQTTGVQDLGRRGIDLGTLTPKPGATQLNLDANVIQTGLLISTVALEITDTTFGDVPVIDTTTPPIYTGFISYTQPAAVPYTAQTKKQRICWILRSDGAIDPA